MEKFKQKILDVLGPLSRLWNGSKDIKNAPDDTVPVKAQDPFKLIEQIVLLLGQASNSILYSQRLQILKTLIKDPKKPKNILAKSSDHILLKQNAPRKELWRFSLVEVVVLLLLPKSPFG